MILADHGARVIAIEDRRFLADGLFFDLVTRNKEHMSLNLKAPEGKDIFFRLLERADVLMEGFRPGVVERLGVDYGSVRKVNPRIVYCAVSGYGQTGPFRNRAGHDVNYLAQAGVLDLIGEPGKPPSIPGVQIADIAGGAMNAAIGILLALLARGRTGEGQYIDISMTDGVTGLLPAVLFYRRLTGQAPARSEGILSHRYACYNTYETGDGRFLAIGALEHRFWKRLCELMGVPEFAPLQYDEGKRAELIHFFRAAFRRKTLAQWEAILGGNDVCWARVQNLEEALADPLFREREAFVLLQSRDGKSAPTLGVPVKLSATPGSVRTPPPAFGEDTAAILRELGYTEGRIRELEAKQVI